MSKRKPRRTSRPVSRRPVSGAEMTQSKSEPVNLVTEYHYVIADLTQIALIAAVLIAGLVGLSFFLK
jgi:hypothetical protein